MKGLRIGRRRGRDSDVALSPLELALRPALVDGRWQIATRRISPLMPPQLEGY